MKLRFGLMMAALGLLSACDKKPVEPTAAPEAAQVKAEEALKEPTEAERAAARAAAEAAGIPTNCDVKIKGEEACAKEAAEAAAKVAGEAKPDCNAHVGEDGAVTNCDISKKVLEVAAAAEAGGCPFHEGADKGHAGHDHAAHGHAGHDHAAHDHAAHAGHAHGEGEIGCNGKPMVQAVPTQAGGIHFGSAFAQAEAKPLAEVAGAAKDGQELEVRVSGTIDKVCQKKGCWMVIKDGAMEARVVMKNAAFTVPLDSAGKPAQVEGTLKVRVFSEAQAKHLAEDGGEDPSKVVGERRELVFQASAVEIGG